MEKRGARITFADAINVLAFNRVLGIGLDASFDEESVEAIMEELDGSRLNRAFVQVKPIALSGELERMLTSKAMRSTTPG